MIARIVFLSILLCCPAAAQTGAPSQLHGKSVVVTWSEDREQKVSGFDHPEFVRVGHELDIYVSSAGRVFNKLTASRHGRGNKGGVRAGASEQVAGEEDTRQVHFQSNALYVDAAFASGARRVSVNFDPGYGSCKAQILTGKAEGEKSTIRTSVITRQRVEVMSAKTNSPSCRVVAGNVFGN